MALNSKKHFWDLKPFWCQPWSIITFGMLVLIVSWLLLHSIIITTILGIFIIIWWVLFLIIAPRSYGLSSDEK